MKSRFTILSTVGAFLLVLGLAITPGFAQNDLSLDVDKTQTMAVDSGHNQKMGKLIFTVTATATDRDLLGYEGDTTITISYGGLKIANETASALVVCAGSFGAAAPACDAQVDHDGVDTTASPEVNAVRPVFSADRTKLVLTVFRDNTVGGTVDDDIITVDGVRVDTSGKNAGDEIMAHISASKGTADGVIDVGGGDARSVSTVISTVGAAVTVPSVSAASAVTCVDGGEASITVKEGFASAWEDIASGTTSAYRGESTSIQIAVLNIPADVKFKWPKEVGSEPVATGPKATETVHRKAGASMLKLQSAEVGIDAVYTYEQVVDVPATTGDAAGVATGVSAGYGHDQTADSFVIKPKVQVGAGAIAHHQAGRCLGIPRSRRCQ